MVLQTELHIHMRNRSADTDYLLQSKVMALVPRVAQDYTLLRLVSELRFAVVLYLQHLWGRNLLSCDVFLHC